MLELEGKEEMDVTNGCVFQGVFSISSSPHASSLPPPE